MGTKETGDFGERIACEYLVRKGFKILERNYRISFGEIDIIAKKKFTLLDKVLKILIFAFRQKLFNRVKPFYRNDKTIHFIEVKTIFGSMGNFFPEERVDFKKRRKLRQLCEIWLQKHKFPQQFPYEIDIIGILINRETKKTRVHYFQNVVGEE